MDASKFNAMVGRNIRFLREEKQIDLRELAEKVKIGKSTLNDIERGVRAKKIDENTISAIAGCLSVTPDAITEEPSSEFKAALEKLESALKQFNKNAMDEADALLEIALDRGPRERSLVFLLRGIAEYYLLGNPSGAIFYYDEGAKIAERASDVMMQRRLSRNKGQALLMLGKHRELEDLLTYELTLDMEMEERAHNLFTLGSMYYKQEKYELAAKLIQEASVLSMDIPMLRSRCDQLLGTIYQELRRWDEAVAFTEKALEIAIDQNDNLCEAYCLRTLGEIQLEVGSVSEAVEFFSKAKERVDEIGRDFESLHLEFLIAKSHEAYSDMKAVLRRTDMTQIPPKDLAAMYKDTARVAFKLGELLEGQNFYESAIKVLIR